MTCGNDNKRKQHKVRTLSDNTVNYHKTSYSIAVIVEKLSNYNRILQEKIEIEEHDFQHKRQGSEVNNQESKLSAIANACRPAMIEEKYEEDDNMFNDNWIKSKKTVSMKKLDKKNNFKEENDVGNVQSNLIDMNTNKFNALSCGDEK